MSQNWMFISQGKRSRGVGGEAYLLKEIGTEQKMSSVFNVHPNNKQKINLLIFSGSWEKEGSAL